MNEQTIGNPTIKEEWKINFQVISTSNKAEMASGKSSWILILAVSKFFSDDAHN